MTEQSESSPIDPEKRKHPRLSLDMPIEYWRNDNSQSRSGRTGDISEGGVLLYLPEKILANQNIGLRIFTGDGVEYIESTGQTAWSDSHLMRKDYYHRAGVRFVGISAENLSKLKNLLNAQNNITYPPEVNIPVELSSTFRKPEMDTGEGQPMIEEPSREGETAPLQELPGDEIALGTSDLKQITEAKLSPELIYDLEEEYTEAQRQNLYRKILDMSISERFRLAVLANREARNFLIHDSNKMISVAVLKNTKVNANEVFQYAQRRDLSQDVLLAIARDQKWKKSYPIKFAVVSNPKTPLSVAISLLPHLREKELKSLSRDSNVSSILSRRAVEILTRKNQK